MKGKLMQFMRKYKWECAFGGVGSVVLIAVLILCAVKFGNLAAGGDPAVPLDAVRQETGISDETGGEALPGETVQPSVTAQPTKTQEEETKTDKTEQPEASAKPGSGIAAKPGTSANPGTSRKPGTSVKPLEAVQTGTNKSADSNSQGRAGEPDSPAEAGNTGNTGNSGDPGDTGNTGDTGNPGGSGNKDEPGGDTVFPEEAGYYLVWDDFTMVSANADSVQGFSSWDAFTPTSLVSRSGGGACYTDNSKYSDAHIQRAFNETAEDLVWEFTLKAAGTLDGTFIDMRYQDTAAIRFVINGDKLEAVTPSGNTVICGLPTARYAIFKVIVSPADGTYTVIADGVTAASGLSFLNACSKVDRMYIETSEEGTGSIYLGTVRIYTGYYVNEKFLNADTGAVSDEWTKTGDVTAAYKTGTQGPDTYSALLKNGAVLSRDVAYEQDGAWVEYQFLLPEGMDELAMVLEDGKGNAFKTAVKGNKFGYCNGDGTFVELYDCMQNVWYHVMLKQTDEGGMLYLNHKLRASGLRLPFEKFTKMSFAAGTGVAYLDDIVVRDWIPYPKDYVPEPVPVVKTGVNKDLLVGLQSCNLWVEGMHFGYDWLTDWEDRKPYLGFYDELLAEVADWELKFKVEHGIDYELFCWYRPQSSNDEPIKMGRNAYALHEGYFNARYSDKMRFAITWECAGGPVSGSQDFRENVVPYWIEQYFKDDRYLVIDNKPVVGMYNVSKLMSYFGGSSAGVRAELDYLRAACTDAGFDGCYVIMSNSNKGDAVNVEQAGFDGQYAYSWGMSSANIDVQKNGMTGMRDAINAAGGRSGLIPVVGMGRDDLAWERNPGGYCTIEDFTELLRWTRNDLMPTLDGSTLGSKMVLLDNWNEYGEGHFIMPSGLHGFGYVDAVREIFGDGNTSHEDVLPTDKQLKRIHHMYIQDRHVVKVDKDPGRADLEVLNGYYFDTEGNFEGWTETPTIDRWSHRLSVFEVKNGAMSGQSAIPAEGENPDPALLSPPVKLSAKGAPQIRVRMKCSSTMDTATVYFITEADASWTQAKSVSGVYNGSNAAEDGYVEIVFDMSSKAAWQGTVTQFRLDPMEGAGSFEIDSIEVMRQKGMGEASVYLDGEQVYTSLPVKLVNNTVMFPVEDFNSLITVFWSERMDQTAVELFVKNRYLFRFLYGSDKMVINGAETDVLCGGKVIAGNIYVPVKDIFEQVEGYTVTWEEEAKKLSIDKEASDEPYKVLKGYYFDIGTEGWLDGGPNKCEWKDGALHGVASDSAVRCWSPEAPMGISAKDITHIRIRVKSTVENPTLKLTCTMDTGGIDFKAPYGTKTDPDGYTTLLIDCGTNAQWAQAGLLNRLGVYAFEGNIGESYDIDSIEILQYTGGEAEEPEVLPTQASPYAVYGWYFEKTVQKWAQGGLTKMEQADGALVITAAKDGRPRVWTSNKTDGVTQNPINLKTEDATHALLQIRTDTESPKLELHVELKDAQGNVTTAKYKDIAYQCTANGYTAVTVALDTAAEWRDGLTIDRMCVFPFGDVNNAENAGKTVYLDSLEILDKNCKIDMNSSYFTNDIEGWSQGGTTSTEHKDGALLVQPPTAQGDYCPRIWSCGQVGSTPEAISPLGYEKGDITHIRVRIKAEVPEGAAVSADTADLTLIPWFKNGTNVPASGAAMTETYATDTEGYVNVTFKVDEGWKDGDVLQRINLQLFGLSGNEELCKAGTRIYIDSVQYLKKLDGDEAKDSLKILIIGNSITQHGLKESVGWLGNWGMAATSPDKDYVHLLEARVKEINPYAEVHGINISEYEKYFYDWSKISNNQEKYANWNADIIIATFGANIQNGANEGDDTFENDEIFDRGDYKKIIDRFNPDGDAKVIIGSTVLTRSDIVGVIHAAANAYGWDYADMTGYTDTQYRGYPYKEQLMAAFGVADIDAGVLNHPGDEGMKAIADDLWPLLKKAMGVTDGGNGNASGRMESSAVESSTAEISAEESSEPGSSAAESGAAESSTPESSATESTAAESSTIESSAGESGAEESGTEESSTPENSAAEYSSTESGTEENSAA